MFGKPLIDTATAGDAPGCAAEVFGAHYDYETAQYTEPSRPVAGRDDSVSKWNNLQPMAGGNFPPVRDPTEMSIPTCSALRIRREQNGRDFVNSRLWDNFHATPPTQTASKDLENTGVPKFMDMNPTSSRKDAGQFRHQLEYMPTNSLPAEKNSTNPYLQRLDAEGSDARNIIRELRSAVSEDNRERDLESSKRLAERQFQNRWMPQQEAETAASLQAYELLRPKQYHDY
jgi:hypothetical protein